MLDSGDDARYFFPLVNGLYAGPIIHRNMRSLFSVDYGYHSLLRRCRLYQNKNAHENASLVCLLQQLPSVWYPVLERLLPSASLRDPGNNGTGKYFPTVLGLASRLLTSRKERLQAMRSERAAGIVKVDSDHPLTVDLGTGWWCSVFTPRSLV